RLALPGRRALPLRLRGWPRALLLAAARHAGDSAGRVHARAHPARVPHAEGLRAVLHHRLRASRLVARQRDHAAALDPAAAAGVGMKIGLVSDFYAPRIGGLELQMRDLARELAARGHD